MTRVGTTAHDVDGLRASSTLFEPFSDVTIDSIAPDPITPGDTVTVTTFDSALVETVYFGGVSQVFAAPTGTTVTFTAPDEFLYGNRAVRLEDIAGGGKTVTHSYLPVNDNIYTTLSGYPPGTNKYGDTILHLGEQLDPQPVDGAQIEVDLTSSSSSMDFELRADASYSVLVGGQVQRRAIYEDGSASLWDDVFINAIPEAGDAIAVAPFSNFSLTSPTGSAIGTELGAPTNLFTSNITRTSARANWSSAG
jgi:hypothetical protein